MPTMGEVLRDARYRLGLSIEQAEADTKVRKKYLLALEEDDYSELPAPIYARGFLQIYSEYLGIDPSFTAKLFQPPEKMLAAQQIRPAASGLRSSRAISMGTLLGVLFTVVTVGAIVYLYSQYLAFASPTDNPIITTFDPAGPQGSALSTPAAVVPIPTQRPEPSPTPTPPPPTPTPVIGVEVEVEITERCWLRVVADGSSTALYEGVLEPGDTMSWTARDRIDMRVGNAGGVEVTVNGMRQGKLGASGEVKNVTWGRQ